MCAAIFHTLSCDLSIDDVTLAALGILPYLLPDVHYKADMTKVLYLAKVTNYPLDNMHDTLQVQAPQCQQGYIKECLPYGTVTVYIATN